MRLLGYLPMKPTQEKRCWGGWRCANELKPIFLYSSLLKLKSNQVLEFLEVTFSRNQLKEEEWSPQPKRTTLHLPPFFSKELLFYSPQGQQALWWYPVVFKWCPFALNLKKWAKFSCFNPFQPPLDLPLA